MDFFRWARIPLFLTTDIVDYIIANQKELLGDNIALFDEFPLPPGHDASLGPFNIVK